MNALKNIVAVQQGKISVKEMSISAVNSFFAKVLLSKPQFSADAEALVAKANTLDDSFFETLDVAPFEAFETAGREIAAAVSRA